MGAIVSAIIDGAFKALFGWISSIMERRGLIAQGRAAQYTDDLNATVKANMDAAQVRNDVAKSSDASVDDYLRGLRDNSTAGTK